MNILETSALVFDSPNQIDHMIDIIGAGIGGLSTAIALRRKGIQTNIYEQAEKIRPVGAGIILANNAMQVYEKLGLKKKIESKGNPISAMKITNSKLVPMSAVYLESFEKKYKAKNIAIHRGDLQQLLLNQLDESTIYLNHRLTHVTRCESGYKLEFESNDPKISSMLLAADGLNSKIRTQLFPKSTIRNANQICWRGITDYNLSEAYKHELNEAWGQGDRFGFVQIAPSKVYWYALKSTAEACYSKDQLNEYFKDYHPIINEIIKSTTTDSIHTAVIADLKPIMQWYDKQVCLIGDAAHATTPNMGQGACQAIEDAYILAECLEKYGEPEAFKLYQKIRIEKAHQVVKTSRAIGKLAHWKNPFAIAIRNSLMRITPEKISRKQTEKVFKLSQI